MAVEADNNSDDEELPEGEVVRRVAFDIGSNATKCQVADVDLASGRILNIVMAQEVPCSFGVDWKQSKDGRLSDRMQDRGLQTLHMLCKTAVDKGATRAAAIATEVFRKASNGEDYLKRVKSEIGLTAKIVTQELEGRLGFLSAVALSSVPRASLICWDCGGASFQVCREPEAAGSASDSLDSELLCFLAPVGVSVATAACVEAIQKKDFATTPSPNPVSAEQAYALVAHIQSRLPLPPDWLVGAAEVVAIGGSNSMFCLATEILAELGCQSVTTFSARDARRALDAVVGRTEEELFAAYCDRDLADPPSFVVPKMALLSAVMDACKLPQVTFQPAIGSCAGMLVSDDLYGEAMLA